jgi:hypothetical protein
LERRINSRKYKYDIWNIVEDMEELSLKIKTEISIRAKQVQCMREIWSLE